MKTAVIIVAAGSGRRMQLKQNKIFLEILEQTVIERTIAAFAKNALIDQVVLVIRQQDEALVKQLVEPLCLNRLNLVYGGKTRTESVAAGCEVLTDEITHVLIHDGARPFVSNQLIQRVIDRLKIDDAVIPAMPLSDTVKVVAEDYVVDTMVRANLRAVQTPQGFERRLFEKMVAFSAQATEQFTDDASVAEALGKSVYCVAGEAHNIKVTSQQDLIWATAIAERGDAL